MIKLTKLTDYAFVVMTLFLKEDQKNILTAKEISEVSDLPMPTASKILKLLSKKGVLEAKRGVNGGYQIACNPAETSVVQLIEAFEGPIALTDCIAGTAEGCLAKCKCKNGTNWQVINEAIYKSLQAVTLKEMCQSDKITKALHDSEG